MAARILDGKLVCVGASITEGYLASNRPELGYVGQLRRLAAESHSTLEIINEGRSGWSTGAFAYNAAKLAEKLPPDATLITILLGTNDAHEQGTPAKIAEDAVRNLDKIIQNYRAKAPRAEFVLITPTEAYPGKFTAELRRAHYDEQTPAKLAAIVEADKAFARRAGLRLIDVSKLPGIEHAPDGVHPDDAGHAMLAQAIWRGLNGEKTPEAVSGAEPTPARPAGGPHLTFERADIQSRVGVVYADALNNLLIKNTVHPAKPGAEDPVGRLTDPPGTFLRAGGGYDKPWTRDASLNSWFAGSLLEPAVARNTLWAVCQRQEDGTITVQHDNQWWDQCIWVKGAWDHYLVTGNRAFLEDAYPVAFATLDWLRQHHFNGDYGLFMGPAFFADGISAYPPPYDDPANHSSFVLDHRYTRELMVLSTNCAYWEAYRCATEMARALHRPSMEIDALETQSTRLKEAINKRLWSPEKRTYAYFIPSTGPEAGKPYFAQEGVGLSFALLFEVAGPDQASAVMAGMHTEPKGVVTLWPNLPQFDDDHLGRHNVMLWPLVNGLWATAVAQAGSEALYAREVMQIADLVLASGHNFYEIYHPQTGQPDGGWQTGSHWGPVPDQTWSAAAYIGAIHRGLFGMGFTNAGLQLSPALPEGWGTVELTGLPYRQMVLDIRLKGQGTHVQNATLDGKNFSTPFVPPELTGQHVVEITLDNAR